MDLSCVASANASVPLYGDLSLSTDFVQGGGVKIAGNTTDFQNEVSYQLSREGRADGQYDVFATAAGGGEQRHLFTLGDSESAFVVDVFGGKGLNQYSSNFEMKNAFPDTETITPANFLDGTQDKTPAAAIKWALDRIPLIANPTDGRISFGKSIDLPGIQGSINCSFGYIDLLNNGVTLPANLFGQAIISALPDSARQYGRGGN